MKLMVACKRVVDFNVKVRVRTEVADYGLVGDLFEIVPELTAAL